MNAPQVPLTSSARRAVAAGMVSTAIEPIDALGAVTVVELLDLLSGTVLRCVGCEDEESRQILSTLWGDR